jgi:hypothetical protein
MTLGLLVLRIVVGALFVARAAQKHRTIGRITLSV